MKKLTALLLAMALIVSLFAGCSGETNDPTGNTGTTGSTDSTDTSGSTDSTGDTGATESTGADVPEYTTLTVAEALAMQLTGDGATTERYLISGTVTSIDNATYGAMTISDDTGSIYIFNSKNVDGTVDYAAMDDKPYAGDTVTILGTLKLYNGTMEVDSAWIQSFAHAEIDVDESQYTQATIDGARAADKGEKVKVTGVVAQITYANGMIPAGVILVDNTGSIYVYDSDLAARVKVGNQITILGTKDYWILDSEIANAQKFGYQGCNQLTSVTLVENDNGSHDFDKSWITETTVKDILDTPVTENITAKIFKVTALITKAPGSGFTNYYFNDLDGVTGSYAYTQCNGSDFAWLDAFDGKFCTVYLTALNAKSTTADCFFRFIPVAVADEGFVFDPQDAASYAVEYHGIGQFQTSYTGNPALELVTEVSSDLLGFSGAKLSYSSSDPSVISIDTADGKTVMNCLKTGTAVITVKGSYNGTESSATVSISVTVPQQEQTYPTVSEAISAAVGETVTVKGIVGPSLVNRSGFYLIDETGVIAVITEADVLATLEIGHEVVLQGMRDKFHDGKGGTHAGQIALTGTVVVANNYGSHEYSTASFDGDITVADFYNLDVTKDYTTSVFNMKATVVLEETQYYTNIYLTDGTTNVRLYCSGAGQYAWLKAYAGQEVTVEIAPCNWNNKNYYVGCVLSVIHADGTKTLNTLNFDN